MILNVDYSSFGLQDKIANLDLQLLKLQAVLVGSAPPGINYRFSITFSSEDLRLEWVASDAHQEVWGTLETFLSRHECDFLLFEII